jgi:hypothetical protein
MIHVTSVKVVVRHKQAERNSGYALVHCKLTTSSTYLGNTSMYIIEVHVYVLM